MAAPATETQTTTEEIRCACGALVGKDWHCISCRSNCYYGFETGPCPRCGNESGGVRKGPVWTSSCACRVPPEQLAYVEELRKKDLARDRRVTRQIEEGQADRSNASACWERKRADGCNVRSKTGGPYDYCASCPKWKTNR